MAFSRIFGLSSRRGGEFMLLERERSEIVRFGKIGRAHV